VPDAFCVSGKNNLIVPSRFRVQKFQHWNPRLNLSELWAILALNNVIELHPE
jgi:hypothetical protein